MIEGRSTPDLKNFSASSLTDRVPAWNTFHIYPQFIHNVSRDVSQLSTGSQLPIIFHVMLTTSLSLYIPWL